MMLMRALMTLCFAVSLASATVLTWGGTGLDLAQAIATDDAGNRYVTGYFCGTANFNPGGVADWRTAFAGRDVFLCKYNPAGILVWVRIWGGNADDTGNGIALDGAGHVYVAGRFQHTVDFDPGDGSDMHNAPNDANDCFLSKFDTDGAFLWARTWGGPLGDEAYRVAADATGAYVVGDFSSLTVDFDPGPGNDLHTNTGFFDAFLSKFNADGQLAWAHTWGGTQYDDCCCVTLDDAGHVNVAGMFGSVNADFDPGAGTDLHSCNGGMIDAFLCQYDRNGVFSWARTWGGIGDDCADCLIVEPNGNLTIAGYFSDTVNFNPGGNDTHIAAGLRDAYLCSFTASGAFAWAHTWGGSGDDRAESVFQDDAGNYYVTGIYSGTADFDPGAGNDMQNAIGGTDAFLVKYSPLGVDLGTLVWGGSGNDMAIGVVPNGAGSADVIGGYYATVDFDPGAGYDPHTATGGSDAFLLCGLRINKAPVATDDAYAITRNTTLPITVPGVLANDADADGDTLTATVIANPAHGTLTLHTNGSFSYTPATNYLGTDTFTYQAHDAALNSNTATATITVEQPGYEADVANGGNGQVTVADWVQVGRYIVGLDHPLSPILFQRTDCAPRAGNGDGRLTTADWVQAGRYAVGVDAWQYAAGPAGE